jgi:predicted DNA-binding transcriptional regulator AlpA
MPQPLKREALPSPTLLADLADVRAALRISKASVYRLVQTGRLPAPRKLGKRSLWPMAEVQKLAQELGGQS